MVVRSIISRSSLSLTLTSATRPVNHQQHRLFFSRLCGNSLSMRSPATASRLTQNSHVFADQAEQAFNKIEAELNKPRLFKIPQKTKDALQTLKTWAMQTENQEVFDRRVNAAVFLMKKDCRLSAGYLKIDGGITMTDKQKFDLPDNLHLNYGSLIITNDKLVALPDNLKVDGSLVAGKSKLQSLNRKLWVGGNLDIHETEISQLPADLHIGKSLIANNTRLNTLPETLRLNGSLYIHDTPVKQLPDRLWLGHNLNISRTEISAFPKDLVLGGDIHAYQCAALNGLPAHLQNLGNRYDFKIRIVDIAETGIPQEQINSLPISVAQGVHYMTSHKAKEHRAHKSLEAAIQSWSTSTRKMHISAENRALDEITQEEFNLFLSRLHTTNDALNHMTRSRHIDRVHQLIHALDKDKFEFRRYAAAQIHNGLESCEDRVMHTLNTLERQIKANEARSATHPEKALKALCKQFMALDEVHRHANLHCLSSAEIDEIEVHLYFEVKCRDILNLPVKTQTMKFERFAKVLKKDIDKAIESTRERLASKEAVSEYEKSWDPLQQFYRERQLKELKWHTLKVEDHQYKADDTCLLSAEEFRQMKYPVLLKGVLYDLKAIGRFWVDKGYDPTTTQRFGINDLKKPASL